MGVCRRVGRHADVERAVRLSYLVGVQAGVEGRVPKCYPLPPQVGDIIQYASDYWQFGRVEAIDGDRMLIWRGYDDPNPWYQAPPAD